MSYLTLSHFPDLHVLPPPQKIGHDRLSIPSDLHRSDLNSCFTREDHAKCLAWKVCSVGSDTSHPAGSPGYGVQAGLTFSFLTPLAFSKGGRKEKSQLVKSRSIDDWSMVGQHCPCHNKHNEEKGPNPRRQHAAALARPSLPYKRCVILPAGSQTIHRECHSMFDG